MERLELTGQQKVLLTGLDFPAGMYTCFLRVGSKFDFTTL